MNQSLIKLGLAEATLRRVQYMPAVDGMIITEAYLKAHKYRLWPRWKTPPIIVPGMAPWCRENDLKAGELGCTLSHIACWQRVVDEGHDEALILEDDCNFANERFDERLHQAHEWCKAAGYGMLYLGRWERAGIECLIAVRLHARPDIYQVRVVSGP